MLPPKIRLNDWILHNIKAARTEKRIPAATLSRAINRDDSYISSLELKRLRTISSVDLVAILCAIFDIPEHEATAKAEDFLGFGARANGSTDLNTQASLSYYGNEDTARVSEPTVTSYWHDTITDDAEPELISDMLDVLTGYVTEFYRKDPKEAVFVLNSFIKTMQLDSAFAMGVMGLPFYALKSLSIDKRMEVLSEFITVLKKHT